MLRVGKRASGHWAIAMAVVLMSPACSEDDSAPGEGSAEEQEQAAEKAKAERWVEVTPEAVAKGKAQFGTCMGCHGEGARGKIGIGPRIASESYLAAASDDFLFETIKSGRPGTTMVPWGSSFSDEQIKNFIAYLRSLHPTDPATLDQSALEGDPKRGAEVYRNICSGCHGRSGAGYQETANGTGIGRKAFLEDASDGFIRYIVKHGKTLTKMKGFAVGDVTAVANLDDQQIEDTIAYLRKNAW